MKFLHHIHFYWFCEDFDEENDCCAVCIHPDDCKKLLDENKEER